MNAAEAIDTVLDFGEAVAQEARAKVRQTLGAVHRNTVRFLITRKRAYQLVFNFEREACKIVLDDLAEFCRAEVSCFHPDPRLHAIAEGRREVWLRVMMHLNRDPRELNKMFGGPNLTGEFV